jgi:putative Ca2+/H+ antiporter (TMEM165/GDT1 family)
MGLIGAALLAFGVVVLVELPDKTLVATLVLSTRYRPRPVLLGLAVAFAIQCAIAAVAGGLIALLPRRAVEAVVAVLFAIGAVLLIKESFSDEADDVQLAESRQALPALRVAVTAFGVLFAAEWGDASQIATAGLVARAPGAAHAIAVAIGAWLALVLVATAAVGAGKLIIRRVPLRLVHRVAGGVFAMFAVFAAVTAVR